LLLKNNPHRTADLNAGHPFNPNQFGGGIGTPQIDLGMTVTKDVNMGRQMIVNKNDHAQAVSAKYSDHSSHKYPIALGLSRPGETQEESGW
jgi:hypothetical protein